MPHSFTMSPASAMFGLTFWSVVICSMSLLSAGFAGGAFAVVPVVVVVGFLLFEQPPTTAAAIKANVTSFMASSQAMMTQLPRLALVVLFFASCGKGGDKKNSKRDDAPAAPVAAPISLPVLGVDKITRFNFDSSTSRARDFEKKGEWQEVRKLAEQATTKDAQNLDAQRLLGIALANTGEQAAAVDHLVAAIAGDYYKYGTALASEP